jgi:hypothetical protein
MYTTPVRFTFDDSSGQAFDGFTDGSRWNGFLNVQVTPEVRDQIVATLRGNGPVGEDGDGSDYTGGIELLPILDGRVDLSNGFCTDTAADSEEVTLPNGSRFERYESGGE